MKLHLGCGERNFGKKWIHIDQADFPHIQSHNIRELPFPDESVSVIYASHVLEYFDRDEVIPIIIEWRRVLREEGILRLAVPNFAKMMLLYTEGLFPLSSFLGPIYGRMQSGGRMIYHKTGYDMKTLTELLTRCGFFTIKRYDWRDTEHSGIDDHSQAYLPKMEKDTGTLISLNVEAKK